MADYPPQLVPTAEELSRRPHLALGDEVADAGGRHRLRVSLGTGAGPQEADPGHVEPQAGAHALEHGHVAFPAPPEVEIVAYHQGTGVQATDQDLLHELGRRLGRPLGVEVEDGGEIGPGGGQQGELLVQVGQQQRGRAGPDHAGRVAIEGDHHGGGTDLSRSRAHPVDEQAVAPVDTVEGPDGHHGAVAGADGPGRRSQGSPGSPPRPEPGNRRLSPPTSSSHRAAGSSVSPTR